MQVIAKLRVGWMFNCCLLHEQQLAEEAISSIEDMLGASFENSVLRVPTAEVGYGLFVALRIASEAGATISFGSQEVYGAPPPVVTMVRDVLYHQLENTNGWKGHHALIPTGGKPCRAIYGSKVFLVGSEDWVDSYLKNETLVAKTTYKKVCYAIYEL